MGPVASKLWLSSSTTDADVFAVLRLFAPDGSEVLFRGQPDPKSPLSQGWLRASHRKLDAGAVGAMAPLPHPRRGTAADPGRGLRARR